MNVTWPKEAKLVLNGQEMLKNCGSLMSGNSTVGYKKHCCVLRVKAGHVTTEMSDYSYDSKPNTTHLHKIILPRLVWSGGNFGYKQHEVIAMSFKHVRTKMLKLLSAVMGCVFLQRRIICYRQFFDYRFVKGAMIRSSSYSQFIVTDSIGANTVMRTHKKNFSQRTLTAH